MTIHGIGGIRLSTGDTDARRAQEAYVSLTRFLTSSYAAALGIQRIAYNTGSAAGGSNYWNQNGAIGNNAFSVYRFMSASVPFNMMLQYCSTNATFGSSPGNPGTVDAGTSGPTIGVVFAVRADGTNAWNGTTSNNGNDAKNTGLVWTSGSSTLFAFPRSNSGGGTHAVLKQNTLSIFPALTTVTLNARLNAVFSEDSAFFAADTNSYSFQCTYFVPYTATTSSVVAPYVMTRTYYVDDPVIALSTTVYGDTAGSAARNGSCAHPNPPSASLGTMILAHTYINSNMNVTQQPNNAVTGSSTYLIDEYPMHLCLYEASYYGYVGYITNWPKIAWGVPQCGISSDGSKLFIGGGLGPNAAKLVVPWSSSVGSPGLGYGREGRMF